MLFGTAIVSANALYALYALLASVLLSMNSNTLMRSTLPLLIRHIPFQILIGLLLVGCTTSDPEIARREGMARSVSRWRSCAPPAEVTSPVSLAIHSISINSQSTSVRVVAYTTSNPGELALPLYYLSRGRWLIAEKDRAYLLDQDCREFRLNDVERSSPLPNPGLLQLEAGSSFEFTLKFPPVGHSASLGWLVYGQRALPLAFPTPEPASP